MLLVAAIVGGAIFATVGDQNIDSVTGFSGGDVVVEDYGVSNKDEIGLNIRSGRGDSVVVSKVNVSDPDTSEYVYKEFTGNTKVGVGSSSIFELPNVSRSEEADTLDVEIIYDTGDLSNLSVTGTISGSIELTDTGSYEGDPEDDHQPISDGGSVTSTIDGFESEDLSDYNQYLEGSRNGQGYIFNDSRSKKGSVSLQYDGSVPLNLDAYERIYADSGLESYPQQGEKFHGWMSYTENGNPGVLFGGPDINNTYQVRLYASYNHFEINKWNGGSAPSTLNDQYISSANIQPQTWYGVEIDWSGDGDITAKLFNESLNEIATISASDSEYSHSSFGVSNYNYMVSGSFNASWDAFEKGQID
jgi:hypothetical protein